MFKKLKIRTKILLAFAAIAIITVVTIAIVAFSIGQSTLEEESFNKLTAVREMKASQIEDYFQLISDQLVTQSQDRMIIEAMKVFGNEHDTIARDLNLSAKDISDLNPALVDYYQNEFLERLIPNLLREVTVDDYLPVEERSRIMQDLYISSNPFETGSKHLLDNPGDGSSYSEAHELYHPIMRDFLEHFGYYDIFLVDPHGDIVYSVFKEVDFGTRLAGGPYSETNFADAFRAALDAEEGETVIVADFEPYHPSYDAPAAFMASPIFEGEEKLGVLIFQLPIDRINDIMTNDEKWADVGLGESGETYLVGPDFLLRNQSRFLIEDSENYFEAIDAGGVPLATLGRIRNLGSTIGLQEVDTEGTRAALSGETGTAIFPDYRDVSVLSSYKPLDIPGMDWVIMSEIDQAEAFAAIEELGLRLALAAVGLITFIFVAAIFFSRSLTNPIVELQAQAIRISAGDMDTKISVDTEDEISDLADTLETMRVSNMGLIGDLADINQNLENLVEERTAELEASEERLSYALEGSNDGLWDYDPQTEAIYYSPRYQTMLGYKDGELVPELSTWEKMVHRDDLDWVRQTMADHLEGKTPGYEAEYRIRSKDGSWMWILARGKIATYDEDGKPIRFVGTHVDITERKENEAQLHLQSSALEAAANGIVITNTEGTIEWVNPAFTDLTGYSSEEAVGQETRILNSGQQDQALFKELWETITAGQVWQGEVINKRKDGTLYPEEMTITPVLDTDGQINRYVAIKQDITERKRAEHAIREKEERIRSIVEIAPDAIISIDEEQKIIMFNSRAERTFGYASAEVMGQPLTMLMPELSQSVHPQEVQNFQDETAITRSMDERREIFGRRKDGTIFPAEAGISKLELDGNIIFTTFFRDITVRKRLEANIADQLSFISSLIDSIPNPIFVIDTDHRYRLFNRSYEEAFGINRQDLIGKSVMDMGNMTQEEKEGYYAEDAALMEVGGSSRVELELPYADGKIHSVLKWFSSFELSDGAIGGIIGIMVDITEQKLAAQTIRDREERLRAVTKALPDLAFIIDDDGRYVAVLSADEELMLDISDEIVGQLFHDTLPQELADRFLNLVGAALASGETQVYEYDLMVPAGKRWFEVRCAPILESIVDKDLVVWLSRDITERKEAERKLTESEAKHRTIFQNSPLGMILFNDSGAIVDCNDPFIELMGSTREQLIAFNTLENASDPEVRGGLAQAIGGQHYIYEGDYTSATGEMTRTLRIIYNPVNPDQTPTEVIATLEDITERKRLEQEIANQLSFVRKLVDTIPNPIFAMGADQRYVLFNKAYDEAYGLDSESLLGGTVMDVESIPLEQRESYYAQNSALLESGGLNFDEIEIPYADGELHSIMQWVTPFEQSDGSIGGLVGITADITEQKKLEQQLAIANERMVTELNFAKEIQLSMLPLIFPAFPTRKEVTVYATLDSAREVGGDFYDFYFLDDDHLCFVIGDVAGKGAPGALMMAVSKTLIKSRASDDDEPASILTHVNDELSQDNKSSMFVTVFLGIINVKTGEFTYTNAGHNPPYIKRKDSSIQKVDAFHGPVIGAMAGMPYGQDKDKLEPGEVIFIYTDGVTELFNENEDLFSEDRLEKLLKKKKLSSAEDIITDTMSELRRFQGDAEPSDDITILAVQYFGQEEASETQQLLLTIKNRYEDMGIVDERFSEFADVNDLPDPVRQSVSIVLDEMLNNIISYAYQGEKEKEIDIQVELAGNRLVITLKDGGVPFNPFSRETPDTSESLEEREIGGLGIHLVRSMMDEYNYQRQISKNVVTLVKLLEDESGG